MHIRNLTIEQTDEVNLLLLRNSIDILKSKVGTSIKAARFIGGPTSMIELQYRGFVIQFCVVEDNVKRDWIPSRDYDKNFFCTFFYHGSTTEYLPNGTLLRTFNEAGKYGLLNSSLVETIPTYEVYRNIAWLCFSSYKPYTATLLELDGEAVIPMGVGAVNAIGEFKIDNTLVPALDYIEPSNTDTKISGRAKIVLIKPGQFLNEPPI